MITGTVRENDSPHWKETVRTKKLDDEVIDLVVDAYTTGVKKGIKEAKSFEEKALFNAFYENLSTAAAIGVKTLERILEELSLNVDRLLLKINGKESFEIAIIIPLDFYLSNSRRNLTDLLIDFENESCNDSFEISFTVIPHRNTLDFEKLFTDGYILKYDKTTS